MASLDLLRADLFTVIIETVFLRSLDAGLIGVLVVSAVFLFFIGQHNAAILPPLSRIYEKPVEASLK